MYLISPNLKIFSKSNRIFYIIPLFTGIYHPIVSKVGESYSEWLIRYKQTLRPDFYTHYNNLYDMLASIALRLKVRYDVYGNTVVKTKQLVGDIFILNNGFDEILLLELFKGIVSVPILRINEINQITEYDISFMRIVKLMIYGVNIRTVSISRIRELVELGYIRHNADIYSVIIRINKYQPYCSKLTEEDKINTKCNTSTLLYGVNRLLTPENLINNEMLNITYNGSSVLELINYPYYLYFLYDNDESNKNILFRQYVAPRFYTIINIREIFTISSFTVY